MRNRICLAVLGLSAVVLGCAPASREAEGLRLVPGRTDIVIDAKAVPTVRFAAAELSNFLSRVLGAPVSVETNRTPGRVAIVLGENGWSRAKGLDPSPLVRDGFLRLVDDDAIYLVGRDDPKENPALMAKGKGATMFERATLFAVYDFLERFAGCRFFFPGELGTVVPEGVSVTVPRGLAKTEPVFTERYYSSHRAGGLWYDKSITMPELQGLNKLRMRYGTQRMPCCHGQRQFHYVPRFAKDHPDWFCLQKNGERYLTDTGTAPHYRNGKLCYSSPIREELYQDVKAYLTGKDAASRGLKRWGGNCVGGRYVDIMPEDSMMECHCPKCQAAYDKGEKMYATEFIWGMTAEIAARLTREGVRGDVCQMAYPPYRRVPRTELPPNVQVMVAEHGPWSAYKPKELDAQLAEIRAWSEKLGHKVWLWTYPGKYGKKYPDCPQISPRAYAKFFRAAAPWICGGYIEIDTDRFAYDVLNVYVYSRLSWDPNLDIEALIADWHAKLFGRGASAMQRAFDRLEEIWMNDVQDIPTVETELGPVTPECSYAELCTRVYSPARVAGIAALFDEAARAVAPGSREARAIAMFRQEIVEPLRARAENSSVRGELARRAKRPVRSILKNGSMDANLDGWGASVADATVVRDTEVKVEGTASVRLTTSKGADAKRYTRASFEQPLKLEKGKKYRLSYFLKAKDVVPYHKGEGAGLCLWEGKDLYTKHPQPLITGSCDWIHLSLDFTARADTGRLQFRICESTGTMWIDGVVLEECGTR